MLRPSYNDLMESVNSNIEEGEEPVMSSRYGIVIAAAKRARQIIAGDDIRVEDASEKKPLSAAVDELYTKKVHLLTDEELVDYEAREKVLLEELARKAAEEAARKAEEERLAEEKKQAEEAAKKAEKERKAAEKAAAEAEKAAAEAEKAAEEASEELEDEIPEDDIEALEENTEE